MSYDNRSNPVSDHKANLFASAPGLVLLGFLFIAGILLLTEHRGHAVLGAFIWVILVVALLLPAFMHFGRRNKHR